MKLSEFVRHAAVREAGIFDYPPAMFKEIQKWMLATYAGHVMALAEQKLKRMVSYAAEVDKNIKAAQKWLKALPAWIKKNEGRTDKSTKVYVGPPGQGQWYAIKADDDYRFLLGTGENRVTYDEYYDAWPAEEALKQTERLISTAIERAERLKKGVLKSQEQRKDEQRYPNERRKQDTELVTLHLVIKEAKKHTSKAKRYRSKAKAEFPVNLTGWKYVKEYHDGVQQQVKDLIAKNDQVISVAKSGIAGLKTEGQVFESGTVWLNPKWGQKIRVTRVEGKKRQFLVEMTTTNQKFSDWHTRYPGSDKPADIAAVLNKTTGAIGVQEGLKARLGPLAKAIGPGGIYMDMLHRQGWGRTPVLQVILYFDPHQNRGGQWSIYNKKLEVDVMRTAPLRSVDNFKKGIAKINRTLEHELQHVGQDVLRQIKELREDAGLPSPKVRQKGVDPSGHPMEQAAITKKKKEEVRKNLTALMNAAKALKPDKKTAKFKFYHRTGAPVSLFIKKTGDPETGPGRYLVYEHPAAYAGDYNTLKEVRDFINEYYVKPITEEKVGVPKVQWHKPRIEHPLRDVEFHTDLGNVVDNFMAQIPGVAKKDWRAFFHTFTGSKSDPRWNINWYFKSWKKNRDKWKNAIREFTKAVKQRGFDAPAA
jgi:hypothetical protein